LPEDFDSPFEDDEIEEKAEEAKVEKESEEIPK